MQVAAAWSRFSSKCNLNSGIQGVGGSSSSSSSDQDISGDLRILRSFELSEHTVAWFLDSCRNNLIDSVAPKFWSHFAGLPGFEDDSGGDNKGKRGNGSVGGANAEEMRTRLAAALEHATETLRSYLGMAKLMEEELGEDYMVVQRCRADFTAMLFGYKVKPSFTVEDEKAIAAPPKVDFGAPSAPAGAGKQ